MPVNSEKKRAYDRAYRKVYYATHREQVLASARAYYRSHHDTVRAYQNEYARAHNNRVRAYSATHREEARARKLMGKYKMTLEAFNELLAKQGGGCASCGSLDFNRAKPVVDHDHATGLVRGILCNDCNLAAGRLADDPVRARKLADYLERTKC